MTANRPAPTVAELAAHLFGPHGLTAQRTDFDERDLIQALAELLPPSAGGDAQLIEDLAQQLLLHENALALDTTGVNGTETGPLWSTRELIDAEQRALALAHSPVRVAGVDRAQLAQALAGHDSLSDAQHRAVVTVAADPRLASVLVGPAGSGKTATLAALADLWARQDRPVLGAALAALTAQRLQADSGIPSSSLARLLADLDKQPLPTGAVVVLDEAGMVGTRQLLHLLEHAHRAHAQVLLVGDPAQLPEIDAGGLFRHLARPAARPAQLDGNQRQTHEWEQGALTALRSGQVERALDTYDQHGRITTATDRDKLLGQLADDYLTAGLSAGGRQQTVLLASRRRDVADLNALVRARLQARGQLAPDTSSLPTPDGPLPLAVGDALITTRTVSTAAGQRLLNGTRLTLTATSDRGVTVNDGTHQHVLDRASAAAALRHGYALTIHKAQGLTIDTALVLADGLNHNAAYTALSRGRDHNQLYLHDPDPQQPALDGLTRRLQMPSGDQLAVLRLPRTRVLHRSALTSPSHIDRPQCEGRER